MNEIRNSAQSNRTLESFACLSSSSANNVAIWLSFFFQKFHSRIVANCSNKRTFGRLLVTKANFVEFHAHSLMAHPCTESFLTVRNFFILLFNSSVSNKSIQLKCCWLVETGSFAIFTHSVHWNSSSTFSLSLPLFLLHSSSEKHETFVEWNQFICELIIGSQFSDVIWYQRVWNRKISTNLQLINYIHIISGNGKCNKNQLSCQVPRDHEPFTSAFDWIEMYTFIRLKIWHWYDMHVEWHQMASKSSKHNLIIWIFLAPNSRAYVPLTEFQCYKIFISSLHQLHALHHCWSFLPFFDCRKKKHGKKSLRKRKTFQKQQNSDFGYSNAVNRT